MRSGGDILSGFSPEDTEKLLTLLVKENIPHFFRFLQDDMRLLGGIHSPEEFVVFPALFAISTLHVFYFLIDKGDWSKSRDSAHMEVACKISAAFHMNYELLMLPNRKRFMRRDCVWVYFTAILYMFLEDVRSGKISLLGEESAVSLEDVRRMCSVVPPEWVISAGAPGTFLKIAEPLRAHMPPTGTVPPVPLN